MLRVPANASADLAWAVRGINEMAGYPSGTVHEKWCGEPPRAVLYRRSDDYVVVHCEGADPELAGQIADAARAAGHEVSGLSQVGLRFPLKKR
jgi:hypothetical protein